MREPESRAGALLESIVLDRHCSHREDGRTARRDGGATRAGLAVVAPVFFCTASLCVTNRTQACHRGKLLPL